MAGVADGKDASAVGWRCATSSPSGGNDVTSGRGIFISYRREDTRGDSGRLDDNLRARYGNDQVFRDIHDSPPGVSFPQHLENSISACRVVLVVIGSRWLESLHARLEQPDDWVRREVKTALSTEGVAVIPVLMNTDVMPQPNELPEDIRAISTITAQQLSDSRWDDDMQRLITVLDPLMWPQLLSHRGDRAPTNWTRKMQLAVACWMLLLAVVALVNLSGWIFSGAFANDLNESLVPYGGGQELDSVKWLFGALFVGFYLASAGTIGILVLGSYRGWRWVFWVALVLLAFVAYDRLQGLSDLSSSIPSTQTLMVTYLPAALIGALSLSLVIWMLIGMVRFGPGAWSTRKPGR